MERHKHSVGDRHQFLVRLNESNYLQLRLLMRLFQISYAIYKTDMTFWKNYQSFHNKQNHLQLKHASIMRIIIC